MENYYEILEVKNDASDEVIKAAYKALIKKYHPDNGGGQDPTGDKMCLVNEAYECLSDPVRRKQYDQKIQVLRLNRGRKSLTSLRNSPMSQKGLNHQKIRAFFHKSSRA